MAKMAKYADRINILKSLGSKTISESSPEIKIQNQFLGKDDLGWLFEIAISPSNPKVSCDDVYVTVSKVGTDSITSGLVSSLGDASGNDVDAMGAVHYLTYWENNEGAKWEIGETAIINISATISGIMYFAEVRIKVEDMESE